jgi:hypothetical protein
MENTVNMKRKIEESWCCDVCITCNTGTRSTTFIKACVFDLYKCIECLMFLNEQAYQIIDSCGVRA